MLRRALTLLALLLAGGHLHAQQPHDLSVDEALGGHTLARHGVHSTPLPPMIGSAHGLPMTSFIQ